MPSTPYWPTVSNNIADITLSTSQITAQQAISKGLPNFSGTPEDWPIYNIYNKLYTVNREMQIYSSRTSDKTSKVFKRSCSRSSETKVDNA